MAKKPEYSISDEARKIAGLLSRTFWRNDANRYSVSNIDKFLRGSNYTHPNEIRKANEPKRIADQAKKKLNNK